jgi:hypothetical protein
MKFLTFLLGSVAHCAFALPTTFSSPLDSPNDNPTTSLAPTTNKTNTAPPKIPFITKKGTQLMEGADIYKFVTFDTPNLHAIDIRNFEVPTDFEMNDLLLSLAQLNGRVTRSYVLGVASSSNPTDNTRHISMIPAGTAVPSNWVAVPGSSPQLYANENLFVGMDRVMDTAAKYGIRVLIPFIDRYEMSLSCP